MAKRSIVWVVKWSGVEREFASKSEALAHVRHLWVRHRVSATILAVES
jgi:hypothetical protein